MATKKVEEVKVEENTETKPTKLKEKVVSAKTAEKPTKLKNKTISADSIEEAKKTPSKKNYHVSKRAEDGKWQVKFATGQKVIKLFDTQTEAIKYAQNLADNQDGCITIHKVDGKIRKQDYSKK